MKKELICIECPNGCALSVEIENGKVAKVEGFKCEKGEKYAFCEIENPVRVLTSTVLADGLLLKMVPVRTDKPIDKGLFLKAMQVLKKIKINKPVAISDVIVENFLDSGADLIATRTVEE